MIWQLWKWLMGKGLRRSLVRSAVGKNGAALNFSRQTPRPVVAATRGQFLAFANPGNYYREDSFTACSARVVRLRDHGGGAVFLVQSAFPRSQVLQPARGAGAFRLDSPVAARRRAAGFCDTIQGSEGHSLRGDSEEGLAHVQGKNSFSRAGRGVGTRIRHGSVGPAE